MTTFFSNKPRLLTSAALLFGSGFATALWAAPQVKTYTSRGVVTVAEPGARVVIKDKLGQEWEYAAPKGTLPAVGKEVKVTYSMQAVKVEAP